MADTMLYKPNNRVYQVYDIRVNKSGYPLFLIYKDGAWVYRSAKHFTPRYYDDGDGRYVYDY